MYHIDFDSHLSIVLKKYCKGHYSQGRGWRETGWGARQRESHERERVLTELRNGKFLLKCPILLSGTTGPPK
jgi:hypothetical protein